jgi:hypothetical protein
MLNLQLTPDNVVESSIWVSNEQKNIQRNEYSIPLRPLQSQNDMQQHTHLVTPTKSESQRPVLDKRDFSQALPIQSINSKTILRAVVEDSLAASNSTKDICEKCEQIAIWGLPITFQTEHSISAHKLDKILPFNLHQRLLNRPNQCAATTENGQSSPRCSKNRKSRKASPPEKIVAICIQLQKQYVRTNDDITQLKQHLEKELITQIYCQTHINKAKGLINAVFPDSKDSLENSKIDDLAHEELALWIEHLTPLDIGDEVKKLKQNWLTVAVFRKMAKAMDDKIYWRNSTPKIDGKLVELYEPERTRGIPVGPALLAELRRPIKAEAGGKGRVYIFKAMFTKDPKLIFMKIGFTTKTLGERLKEIKNEMTRKLECSLELELTREFEKFSEDEVPQAKRLESLIHTELKSHRYQIKKSKAENDKDKKWFREFFLVDFDYAKKIYLKWRDWMKDEMRGQVYEEIKLHNTTFHILNRKLSDTKDLRNQILKICEKTPGSLPARRHTDLFEIKPPSKFSILRIRTT